MAQNLVGSRLLAHGDMDNNVHPAGTIRLMDALIPANKRLDFILLPGSRTPTATIKNISISV